MTDDERFEVSLVAYREKLAKRNMGDVIKKIWEIQNRPANDNQRFDDIA